MDTWNNYSETSNYSLIKSRELFNPTAGVKWKWDRSESGTLKAALFRANLTDSFSVIRLNFYHIH